MATGGNQRYSSEPRKRTTLQRITNSVGELEDVSSLGSSKHEDRPNNWDCRLMASLDSNKRMKKGNPEKEKERERENSVGHDLVLTQTETVRHRTPATFPRTKMSSVTPMSQRLALENLRQQLSFSDVEDGSAAVSVESERNNERYVPRQRQEALVSRNETGSSSRNSNAEARNTNITGEEDGPDSSQIVGRLMQIRDYIKQASTMMETLKKSPDLRESQEQYTKLGNLVDHLREQEQGYLNLLQKVLSAREETLLLRQNSSEVPNINDRPESVSEVMSADLELRSETSESTSGNNGKENGRPRIEDKLGYHSDTEQEEVPTSARSSASKNNDSILENTLVETEENTSSSELAARRMLLESDLVAKNDELHALREQHELLKKMLEQQEQLKLLKGRQATLLNLQRDAEFKLAEERVRHNDMEVSEMTRSPGASALDDRRAQEQDEMDGIQEAGEDQEGEEGEYGDEDDDENVTPELRNLRERLDHLRSIYSMLEEQGEDEEQSAITLAESELSKMSVNRHDLEDKLTALQEKKQHMDDLLGELQTLKSSRVQQINNELDGPRPTPSPITRGQAANAAAGQTAAEANEVLDMLDSRKKHKKLHEVRERLDQLRDLVQYYQSHTEFIHGNQSQDEQEDLSSIPGFSDYGDQQNNRRAQKGGGDGPFSPRHANQESTSASAVAAAAAVKADRQERATESQDSESQLSDSLAAWGDDPEITDKVKKLKAAKDKLARLQELVTSLQQSPSATQGFPEEFADLAGGDIDGEESEDTSQTSDNPMSREGQSYASGDPEYKVAQQRAELDQLMQERRRLLVIQDQLQTLHDQLPEGAGKLPAGLDGAGTGDDSRDSSTQVKSVSESAQVTFQDPLETVVSNEELYDRMRQQRMMREELRQKKKELEDLMRKDRPRKQYSRNQDNQSDNVSYSNKSEPFGNFTASLVSGDNTVATWGGSTADNLESIEEDENDSGAGQDGEEVDDGNLPTYSSYPSDGIIQVEEEEEAQEDSDDRDTYTIEEDYRPRGSSRRPNKRSSAEDVVEGATGGSRKKGAPPLQGADGDRQYNYWAPGSGAVLNNMRGSTRQQRTVKRKVATSSNNEMKSVKKELKDLKQQLHKTNETLVSLVQGNQLAVGMPGSSGVMGSYSHQLQQQQMMMSLNHCYTQLMQQQQEMTSMQQRICRLSSSQGGVEDSIYPTPFPTVEEEESLDLRAATNARGYRNSGSWRNTEQDVLARPGPGFGEELYHSQSYQDPRQDFVFQPHLNSAGESTPVPDDVAFLRGLSPSVFSGQQRLSGEVEKSRKAQSRGSGEDVQAPRWTAYLQAEDIPIETVRATDRVPRIDTYGRQAQSRTSPSRENMASAVTCDKDGAVIGCRFPTSRANEQARAKLASQQTPTTAERLSSMYRPGLSAGISGTTFLDTASVSSAVSSIAAENGSYSAQRNKESSSTQTNKESGDVGEFSLFEALRETIYSEVATLISQNETRPHYLIELFRELQMLNTDYLRQRALYALQGLVARYLTDGCKKTPPKKPAFWVSSQVNDASEFTPSESLGTMDEDEVKITQGVGTTDSVRSDSMHSDKFDYAEPVETTSSMSTPSSTYWESPFAQDSLGDTVIHLDKALKQMRDQEKEEAAGASSSPIRSSLLLEGASAAAASKDQASEGSMSDVPYPRIDTQQLDKQIKNIMTEIIPVLKEHMEEVCSQQLLAYIQRLVLSLTKQPDHKNEFVRFFHKQLGTILQDSLAKFEGRKMRDCGEDLLVDLSEILFNELAFFRLMQDLDDPKAKDSQTSTETATTTEERCKDSQLSQETDDDVKDDEDDDDDDDDDTSDSESELSSKKDDDKSTDIDDKSTADEGPQEKDDVVGQVNVPDEEENLGKDRDDELAGEIMMPEDIRSRMIELAPSETKPMNIIGSDEDDEGEDEALDNDDPSDTAVSRNTEPDESSDAKDAPAPTTESTTVTLEDGPAEKESVEHGPAEKESVEQQANEQDKAQPSTEQAKAQPSTEQANGESEPSQAPAEHVNGDVSPALMNGEVADSEDVEVTLDDLPSKLAVDKPQLEDGDSAAVTGAQLVLSTMESGDAELAGDGVSLKEPESTVTNREL